MYETGISTKRSFGGSRTQHTSLILAGGSCYTFVLILEDDTAHTTLRILLSIAGHAFVTAPINRISKMGVANEGGGASIAYACSPRPAPGPMHPMSLNTVEEKKLQIWKIVRLLTFRALFLVLINCNPLTTDYHLLEWLCRTGRVQARQ